MSTRDQIIEAMARAICAAESSPAEHWIAFRVTASDALDAALPYIADVPDQWTQPGTPGDPCWLAIGNELGKVADAIRALEPPR